MYKHDLYDVMLLRMRLPKYPYVPTQGQHGLTLRVTSNREARLTPLNARTTSLMRPRNLTTMSSTSSATNERPPQKYLSKTFALVNWLIIAKRKRRDIDYSIIMVFTKNVIRGRICALDSAGITSPVRQSAGVLRI